MSLSRLEEHRRIWQRKPELAAVYEVWFDALLAASSPGDRVVEVGSGPGFLSGYARRKRPDLAWTATDVIAAPWNDLAADALQLPIRSASVDGVLGLDVLHHLARPAVFFGESARVLRPGGRLAVLEPWISPLSFPVYRFLHQEECRLTLDPWNPFHAETTTKDAFAGDAAVLWRLARLASADQWRRLGFSPPRLRVLNGFAYLLSLGFRTASLLPPFLVRPLVWLDRVSRAAGSLFGMRALAVWERVGTG